MQKSKTNYFSLILISLCFVLFVSGAYYLGHQSVKIPETPSIIPTDVSPVVTVDPLDGWKTYRNDQLGIEFRYPDSSATVEALPNCNGACTSDNPPVMYDLAVNDPTDCEHGGCTDYFQMTIFVDPNSPTFHYYQTLLPPKTKYIDSVLGGLIFKELVNLNGTKMVGGIGTEEQFYTSTSKYGYFIKTGSLTNPVVKAIISSLKFTENKAETSGNSQAVIAVRKLPEVINYFKTVPNAIVEFDHETEDKSAWVIHVYENKEDHIATFNWFDVNKSTKKITKEFDF